MAVSTVGLKCPKKLRGDPFSLKSMRVEVKITTPGSQAACSRLYRRIDDDYQDN